MPIVVPLDGSAVAEQALVAGVAIARSIGSELHLVRVCNPAADARKREGDQAYLHALADRLRSSPGCTRIVTALLDGMLARALVSFSRQRRARLMVLTTQSTWAAGLRAGRVAEKIARLARVPALLVRPDVCMPNGTDPDWSCERIVAALDGSEPSHTALTHVTTVGLALRAEVTLVRVVNPAAGPVIRAAEAHVARIAHELRAQGLEVATLVVYGAWPVAEAVNTVARDLHADLIAIPARGDRKAMPLGVANAADLLVSSITEPVLRSPQPVIAGASRVLTSA